MVLFNVRRGAKQTVPDGAVQTQDGADAFANAQKDGICSVRRLKEYIMLIPMVNVVVSFLVTAPTRDQIDSYFEARLVFAALILGCHMGTAGMIGVEDISEYMNLHMETEDPAEKEAIFNNRADRVDYLTTALYQAFVFMVLDLLLHFIWYLTYLVTVPATGNHTEDKISAARFWDMMQWSVLLGAAFWAVGIYYFMRAFYFGVGVRMANVQVTSHEKLTGEAGEQGFRLSTLPVSGWINEGIAMSLVSVVIWFLSSAPLYLGLMRRVNQEEAGAGQVAPVSSAIQSESEIDAALKSYCKTKQAPLLLDVEEFLITLEVLNKGRLSSVAKACAEEKFESSAKTLWAEVASTQKMSPRGNGAEA
jgi:hypothetical protein